MPVVARHSDEPTIPSTADRNLARDSRARLSSYRRQRLRVQTPGGETVTLPVPAVALLLDMLAQMEAGNAVALMPIHAELTTQEAADLLGVSRPFVVKEVAAGAIPHHKVGTHRRIRFKDLMDYKHRVDRDRRQALDELSEQAQKLGMGY